MDIEKISKAYELRMKADAYNDLSEYEKFKKNNQKRIEKIHDICLRFASEGHYGTALFLTYRYNDPEKDMMVQYWRELGYSAEMYEPGLVEGDRKEPSEEELKAASYRHYKLAISWKD